jgi:UPF0716 protein FxsA
MARRWRFGCVALVAYPFVEIALAIALASIVGWWWVLVIIVTCVALGLGLVRYALGATGSSLAMALAPLRTPPRAAIEGGRSPLRSPAQTLLIVPAGVLIALPGLLTSTLGLLLWLPPVRQRWARRWEAAIRRALPAPPPQPPPEDAG